MRPRLRGERPVQLKQIPSTLTQSATTIGLTMKILARYAGTGFPAHRANSARPGRLRPLAPEISFADPIDRPGHAGRSTTFGASLPGSLRTLDHRQGRSGTLLSF